jgi:hypothetical protein
VLHTSTAKRSGLTTDSPSFLMLLADCCTAENFLLRLICDAELEVGEHACEMAEVEPLCRDSRVVVRTVTLRSIAASINYHFGLLNTLKTTVGLRARDQHLGLCGF